MSSNDKLRDECRFLGRRLAKAKKISELSRKVRVHPNQVRRYLDGFGSSNELMQTLLLEGNKILAKEGEKA